MIASLLDEENDRLREENERLRRELRAAEMAAPLYKEHQTLAEKIFTGGLTDDESKRLDFVRDQLDVLETRRMTQWERMTALIAFHRDCFTTIIRLIKRERIEERQNVDVACEVAERALSEKP